MTATPRTGRCQHCGQTRPLFHHEGELHYWGYNPDDAAWLCSPHWQARETAIDNDRHFEINTRIKPFAEQPTEASR
jgi:hypothetical protein